MTLTVTEQKPFEITKQPVDTTVSVGEMATFTVEAEGPGEITYQWWFKNKGKTSFTKTVTTAEYQTAAAVKAMDGRQVYCDVTCNGVTKKTNTVTLTVTEQKPFEITKQPENTTVSVGEVATFTVEAQGPGEITYQWWFKNKGKTTFSKTVTTAEYQTAAATMAMDGRQVYCDVTCNGETKKTNTVTLTVSIVSGDFVFEKIEGTNNLRLIEYKGNDQDPMVPGSVDSMTVTEIGKSPLAEGEKGVFEGNTTITSIELPNSITKIGERAFKGCSNLSTMTTY